MAATSTVTTKTTSSLPADLHPKPVAFAPDTATTAAKADDAPTQPPVPMPTAQGPVSGYSQPIASARQYCKVKYVSAVVGAEAIQGLDVIPPDRFERTIEHYLNEGYDLVYMERTAVQLGANVIVSLFALPRESSDGK